jgi:polysaccharide biosynthesis transport protein
MGWADMSFLRRYLLWIIVATAACIAGSWVIAAGQSAQYSATASVDVESNVIPGVVPATPNLATEVQVATSGSVLSAASSVLGMTNQQLLKHLSVSNKANTNILSIACSEPSATAAASCANAVATAYTNFRNDAGSSKATQAKDPLHVTIVTNASVPTSKSSKRKVELLAVGVIFGLMLGVGTAYLRDRLDDRVRDRADLGHCLNAPVLTDIPAVRRGAMRPEAAPGSALAEAYRHLRARISPLLVSPDGQGRVVLVTSAQPGEGRTSVATNLAVVMARTGARVLLVDADLRNRALSHRFQVRGQPGLTDLLADPARIGDAIMPANLAPGLSFMAAGRGADRPGDLLDTARLRRTFAQLKVMADVIIIDSGPVRAVSDPLALVAVSDIVLIVADVRRTRRAAVAGVAEEIRESGALTLAGVLNRVAQRWRRDVTSARGTGGTPEAGLGALEVRASEPTKISAGPNGSARADWQKPDRAEPGPLRGDGRATRKESVTSHDEPGLLDDETMIFRAVAPAQFTAGAAPGAGAAPNGSGNGSGPSEVEATAEPQAPS